MAELSPILQAGVLGEVGHRVTGIAESTRLKIMRAIEQGVADGLGAAELGKLIESSAAFGEYRAEMIARTETNRALNVSQVASYKQAGVNLVEVIDGDLDAECIARQQKDNGWGPGIYSVNEAYSIEDHPNGTLDWAPVVFGDVDPVQQAPPQQDPIETARQMVPPKPTSAEMEDILKRSFPGADVVNIEKMHVSIRSEVASILDDLATRYPSVKLDRIVVAPAKKATAKVVARTPMVRNDAGRLVEGDTRVELVFDSKVVRGPKSLQTAADAYRVLDIGVEDPWTVWPENWSFMRKTLTHEFGHAIDYGRFGGKVDITSGVAAPSRYPRTARSNREAEFFAEAFVQYEAGIDTPAARAVAERLR